MDVLFKKPSYSNDSETMKAETISWNRQITCMQSFITCTIECMDTLFSIVCFMFISSVVHVIDMHIDLEIAHVIDIHGCGTIPCSPGEHLPICWMLNIDPYPYRYRDANISILRRYTTSYRHIDMNYHNLHHIHQIT